VFEEHQENERQQNPPCQSGRHVIEHNAMTEDENADYEDAPAELG
jgi:hypothetical protein